MPDMTVTEAAQLLGVSRQTIINWINDGRLAADRPSGLRRGWYRLDGKSVRQAKREEDRKLEEGAR